MYQRRFGRTDEDLAQAEDHAHGKAAEHGGAKVFHVVEVFDEDDLDGGSKKGRLFVVDEEGLAILRGSVDSPESCWATVTVINTMGVNPSEVPAYLSDTDRLTIRNNLLASELGQDGFIDNALATAISHVLSPVVAKMLADHTTTEGASA